MFASKNKQGKASVLTHSSLCGQLNLGPQGMLKSCQGRGNVAVTRMEHQRKTEEEPPILKTPTHGHHPIVCDAC